MKVLKLFFNTLTPSVNYYEEKIKLRFKGSLLQKKSVTYIHKKTANPYVVYEKTSYYNISSYPTLENALFEAVKF